MRCTPQTGATCCLAYYPQCRKETPPSTPPTTGGRGFAPPTGRSVAGVSCCCLAALDVCPSAAARSAASAPRRLPCRRPPAAYKEVDTVGVTCSFVVKRAGAPSCANSGTAKTLTILPKLFLGLIDSFLVCQTIKYFEYIIVTLSFNCPTVFIL